MHIRHTSKVLPVTSDVTGIALEMSLDVVKNRVTSDI